MELYDWLATQRFRTDGVGELARYIANDQHCPYWSNRLSTHHIYLIYRNAPDNLIAALAVAFAEWRRTFALPAAR